MPRRRWPVPPVVVLVCANSACRNRWEYVRQRGRPPKFCPDCRLATIEATSAKKRAMIEQRTVTGQTPLTRSNSKSKEGVNRKKLTRMQKDHAVKAGKIRRKLGIPPAN